MMALKRHESCVRIFSGRDPPHPPAAVHGQDFGCYEATPPRHRPPRHDSSDASLTIPIRPEDVKHAHPGFLGS